MNMTSKWISLPLISGLFFASTSQAHAMKIDLVRDCKQMVMAQRQLEKSANLLTSPSSHAEKVAM